MKIAITGSTGMIGAALAKVAINEGHEVIAIIRPGSPRIDNLPNSDYLKIVECEISEYKKIFDKERCDIFFHLAWDKTSVAGRDDVDIQYKNIGYTLDAVRLSNNWGASVFVGAGSQAEYGRVTCKLNGETSTDPTSGYGIAKYTAGKLSRLLCKQLGIRFNWARILSVYGELDAAHTLMMYLIRTLLAGQVPQLTMCEQTWDYVYSEDAASALLAIGIKGKEDRTYCIGSGETRPLSEYVRVVRDSIDSGLDLGFGARSYYPHQAMILCADISNLTKDTGFKPVYSFKDGISRTIKHIKSQTSTNI